MGTYIRRSAVIFFVLAAALDGHADGIGTLVKFGASQKEIVEALDRETKAFKAVKKAVAAGSIKRGQRQKLIRSRYGSPVIIIAGDNNSEKWVYKPAYATYFDNIKIYLFFDNTGRLTDIEFMGG